MQSYLLPDAVQCAVEHGSWEAVVDLLHHTVHPLGSRHQVGCHTAQLSLDGLQGRANGAVRHRVNQVGGGCRTCAGGVGRKHSS